MLVLRGEHHERAVVGPAVEGDVGRDRRVRQELELLGRAVAALADCRGGRPAAGSARRRRSRAAGTRRSRAARRWCRPGGA